MLLFVSVLLINQGYKKNKKGLGDGYIVLFHPPRLYYNLPMETWISMTGLIMISQVERVQNESLLWTSSYLGFHIIFLS